MGERKMIGRNVVIGLGIICIILAIVLGGVIVNYTSVVNGKDNIIATNNAQIETLTNEKSQLQTWLDGNRTLLDQAQIWLQANVTYYNSQINSKNSQITLLNSQITSLQNQIANLNYQVTNLQNQIASLNSQIINLQNQYANLQSDYNKLMDNYTQALAKIPQDKGISLDSVTYVDAGGLAGVTEVVVRNRGVNATTVISMKLYWNNDLASSVAENVTIAGNSAADIKAYLPINGYNSVYDTWLLKVYTLEGYTATSDPLPIMM